jgi:phage/plasmid-associated DNA primase
MAVKQDYRISKKMYKKNEVSAATLTGKNSDNSHYSLERQVKQAIDSQKAENYFETEIKLYCDVISGYLACLAANKEYPHSDEMLVDAIQSVKDAGRLSPLNIREMGENEKLHLLLKLYHYTSNLLEKSTLRSEIEKEFQAWGKTFERHYQAFCHQQEIIGDNLLTSEASPNNQAKKQDTEWADEITDIYQNELAWDNTVEQWRQYGVKHQGVWSEVSTIQVHRIVKKHIQFQGKHCSASKLASVEKILRVNLFTDDWAEKPNLIPFEDGVYNRITKELEPHSPNHRLTWRLPYCYNSDTDSFHKIDEWLNFATKGDQGFKDILIAYLVAIMTKRSDLQKFVLLQGKGGSGKGTFIRLACDLIGKDNVHSSTLSEWNGNKFEPANGYLKQLIVFSDEQTKHKDLGNFFKLTGQDYIRAEKKGKQAFQYQFNGNDAGSLQ